MIITIIDRHMPITLVTRTRELAFLTLMSEVELEEEGEEAELDVGKTDDRGKVWIFGVWCFVHACTPSQI